MGEFFKGWKRKLGVATLLMALAFTAAWMRSRFYSDGLSIQVGSKQQHWIISDNFGLYWTALFNRTARDPDSFFPIEPRILSEYVDPQENSSVLPDLGWRWHCGDFHFAQRDVWQQNADQYTIMIPYWSLVLPLTLLSAYLLLSKPRSKKPDPGPIAGESHA